MSSVIDQSHAQGPTESSVEEPSTESTAPSSHEQDEAAPGAHISGCFCRDCRPMTFAQKKIIVELAQSSLDGPCEKLGHESRLIAVAEACKSFCLPNELVVQILTQVEELDMYRVHFAGPGERRWLTPENIERMEAEEAYKRVANAAAARGAHIMTRRAVAREAAAVGAGMMAQPMQG